MNATYSLISLRIFYFFGKKISYVFFILFSFLGGFFLLFVFISPFHVGEFSEMSIILGCPVLIIIIKETEKSFLECLAHMRFVSWVTPLRDKWAVKWPFDFEVEPKSHSPEFCSEGFHFCENFSSFLPVGHMLGWQYHGSEQRTDYPPFSILYFI